LKIQSGGNKNGEKNGVDGQRRLYGGLHFTTGLPRFISGMMGGIIYVGKSSVNKFTDPDLPRGKWDRPEMSNTYYEFTLNPQKLQWVP
jgi:hypothetical protein